MNLAEILKRGSSNRGPKNFIKKIEKSRDELINLISEKGLLNEKTIIVSQELLKVLSL